MIKSQARLGMLLLFSAVVASAATPYVVVVSRDTAGREDWKPVIAALTEGREAKVLTYEKSLDELAEALCRHHPEYTCFVARPDEVSVDFVTTVHQRTRAYDDDPYTDTLWGILTGYDAENALQIARHREPLVVRKVASGTDIALEMVEEGGWYDELVAGKKVWKKPGGEPVEEKVPTDTTKALADCLNEYQADCFVTSGHATQRDWQIGYRYRNGSFRSQAGQLYGLDTEGARHEINSPNPKVYLPIGNCLMGDINGPDAMALAWMNSAGVYQMLGYMKPTWFGYMGWGCLDYYLEQPGRFTLTEAFWANQQALLHLLQQDPDNRGMQFDRDMVTFYGDPAWDARLAPGPCAWGQSLVEKNGVYTFTIKPGRGEASFKPINTNGSQRGWRPIVQRFPERLKDFEVLEGGDLQPVLADDFILVPNPRKVESGRTYQVRFRARPVGTEE